MPGLSDFTQRAILLMSVILVAAATMAAAAIVLPLLFAIFFTAVLRPMDRAMADVMPGPLKPAVHVLTGCMLLVGLALFGLGAAYCVNRIMAQLPDLQPMLEDRISQMTMGEDGLLSFIDTNLELGGGVSRAFEWAAGWGAAVATSAGSAVTTILIIFFFTVLMLGEAERWHKKLCNGLPGDVGRRWHQVFTTAGDRFRWYLLVRTAIGILTALVYGAVLWAFGLELLWVWIIATFVLNFIPTIGSIIGGSLPVLYALLTRDLQTTAFIALSLFAAEQVTGNYIDPILQGRQLALSPLVILVSLFFWVLILGLPAALIAVPLTVFVVLGCAAFERSRPVALFLSKEPDYDELEEVTGFGD